MSLNDLVPPERRPPVITLVSQGGLGKTTLASMFPRPVFIRTEDGTQSIADKKNIALFPLSTSGADVVSNLRDLLQEDHKFQTVVIDSVTQLNVFLENEIVAMDGKAKSINQANGGYGAGYGAVARCHYGIRELCERLRVEKNMTIVFLAHADTETISNPDTESFQRYTLRMNSRSVSHYVDNVDLVGFITLKTYVNDGKAISTPERVIRCYPTASSVGKNRYGIDKDIPFVLTEFPFKELFS